MEDRLKSLASEEQKAKAREKMAAHAQAKAKDSGAPALASPPPGEERQQGCAQFVTASVQYTQYDQLDQLV